MTRLRTFLRFLTDRSGAVAVEFALVSILFLGLMVGTVDVARLLWEANSIKAGTRAAVRYAVVHQPAATNLIDFDAVTSLGYAGGAAIPASVIGTYTCTSAACTCAGGSACGSAGVNTANFDNIVAVMQAYYVGVDTTNVVVQYKAVGLGFAGNPFGPDVEPLVTVRLCQASDGSICTPMQFAPGVLQAFGVAPFNMPPVASSLSGEDLS
jgi:Flp pilus assembly protein TadG